MARTFVADVEKQIQKKQEKLVSLQEQIEIITGEIEELEKKKKEARYQDLIAEFEKSGRAYEDVIEFLGAVPKADNQLANGKRRGRPKKLESVVMATE